ncbi:16436_t:CDS:1 [Funneliformis geosporum]|nr:16436_t:CDS:1 [Funneliformis geosporum]
MEGNRGEIRFLTGDFNQEGAKRDMCQICILGTDAFLTDFGITIQSTDGMRISFNSDNELITTDSEFSFSYEEVDEFFEEDKPHIKYVYYHDLISLEVAGHSFLDQPNSIFIAKKKLANDLRGALAFVWEVAEGLGKLDEVRVYEERVNLTVQQISTTIEELAGYDNLLNTIQGISTRLCQEW